MNMDLISPFMTGGTKTPYEKLHLSTAGLLKVKTVHQKMVQ